MKNTPTLKELQHLRILESLNCDDDEIELIEPIMFRSPTENCKQLIKTLFKESHQIYFEQFRQFNTITDLNLLKQSLQDYSDKLQIMDENNFTNYFIKCLPHQNEIINESMFEIYTSLVSQYYQNQNEIWQIILICANNLANKYYAEVFTAICMTQRAFTEQWYYLFNKLFEGAIKSNVFLKASIGLITNNILPPDREMFIQILISSPTIGIFNVLKVLNLTQEEITHFGIHNLLVQALTTPDDNGKLTSDVLVFLGEKSNAYLLQSKDIYEPIFFLMECGNFKQKHKIFKFLDKLICGNYIPVNFAYEMVQKPIIEISGEMLLCNSLEIQLVSLRIIGYCIYVDRNAIFAKNFGVIQRCHEDGLYHSIYDLTMSDEQSISSEAIRIIKELEQWKQTIQNDQVV